MASTLFKLPDLETVLFQLDGYFRVLIADDMYESFRQAVLSAPDVHAPELRHWLADSFLPTEFTGTVGRDYVARAWIAYAQAVEAQKKGEASAAWYYVSEARFHEGQMAADLVAMERIERMRRAGRKGGQKTGVRRSPLIREGMRLLTKHRPAAGWKSHEEAFDCISTELLDFSICDGNPLTRDDLSLKVMDWLAKHPDVRAAYQGEEGRP